MNICYVLSRFLCKMKINSHSYKIEMHTKQRTEVSHGMVGEKDEIGGSGCGRNCCLLQFISLLPANNRTLIHKLSLCSAIFITSVQFSCSVMSNCL